MKVISHAVAVLAVALIPAATRAVPTAAVSLNSCQNAVKVQTANFVRNKMKAIGTCVQKISTEIVKNNHAASGAAAVCVAQFRKLNDSRGGRSLTDVLAAKITKACDPDYIDPKTGTKPNTHTLQDILGTAAGVPQPLDAESIGGWCARFGGDGSIDTLTEWINCVTASAECSVDAAISTQYPRALEWLDSVRVAMAAPPLPAPSSSDPNRITDAVAGLNAVKVAIDGPDDDDVPSIHCGGCESGLTDCSGACVNLQNDPQHCNSCGNACAAGQACAAGACACSNAILCGSTCADPLADPQNCGSCNHACAAANGSSACSSGSCTVASCNPGFADCNALPGDGCEANTNTSTGNCGGCGIPCAPANGTGSCSGGTCTVSGCASGFGNCDGLASTGCETGIGTDVNACGGCGIVCSSSHITRACAGGLCNGTCNVGFADCNSNKQSDGCETGTGADVDNCGSCGTVCSSSHITRACAGSVCNGTCNAGFADCNSNKQSDGCETSTTSDVANCGGCGILCAPAHGTGSCSAGTCTVIGCNPGFGNCDGLASTGCETVLSADVNNCGGCGMACSSNNITRACAGSVCNGTCNSGFTDCNGDKKSDGCEINTNTDANHCGTCTTVCSPGHACAAGICQ